MSVASGLTLLAVLVGACGGFGGDSSSDGASPRAADPPGPVESAVAADRKQTFTATVDLEVDRLDRAVHAARAAVEGLGGFAASEDVDLGSKLAGSVTYRVPSADFRGALDAIGRLGQVRNQQVRGQDVTAEYADLDSRVSTLRTSVDRLRSFLAGTTDVGQVTTVEKELTEREGQLESMEQQRRVLADQVALSTVTVAFHAAGSAAEAGPSFLGGLGAGLDAGSSAVTAVSATIGFLLPFLPVLLAVGFLLRWRRRRRAPAL
jgi:hypothetical protein